MFSSQGITFAFTDRYAFITYKISADIIQAKNLLYGDLSGRIDASNGNLDGTADLNYYYKRDIVYERIAKEPTGIGYGISIETHFQSPYSEHTLSIKDAFFEVLWDQAPTTRAHLNTDRIADTDQNGKLTIRPLGSGWEGYKKLKQKLPARLYLSNSAYITRRHHLLINFNYLAKLLWPAIGYRFVMGKQQISMAYGIKDKSLGVNHQLSDNLSYSLQLDNIQYKKAHRVNLSFAIQFF